MFRPYNPNPTGKNVGDCTVRALTKGLGRSWEEIYTALALQGYAKRGTHYVRGHYSKGRYSRDDAKSHMIDQLDEMMEQADTAEMKDAIRRCKDQLERA